jgi:hypothetical protein
MRKSNNHITRVVCSCLLSHPSLELGIPARTEWVDSRFASKLDSKVAPERPWSAERSRQVFYAVTVPKLYLTADETGQQQTTRLGAKSLVH